VQKKEELFAVVVEAGYRERKEKAGAHARGRVPWICGIFTRHLVREGKQVILSVRVDLASGAAAARQG